MLISVIIPCYNVEAYIEECLGSVFRQTYRNIEVICVDNNSTDNTAKVIVALKEKYPKLVLDTEVKKGANAARNKGLKLAKGEWIQFLDADDVLDSGKIEHQVRIIKNNPTISFIAGSTTVYNLNGILKKSITITKNIWVALATSEMGITSANLFKNANLVQINGWDENLESSQEYDLMFRLLQISPDVFFDEVCLTKIFRREGSISTNTKENLKRRILLNYRIYNHAQLQQSDKEVLHTIAQSLFEIIKELFKYEPEASIEFLRKTIGDDFEPTVSSAITRKYLILHKVLGFRSANRLVKYIKG